MTGLITTLPLEPAARERLSARLDARVMDIREPVETVGLVLTPPRSPQLIGALRLKYEAARVVIIELDDWDFDIRSAGPVKRILRAGADAYVLAEASRSSSTGSGLDRIRIAISTTARLSTS